MKTLLIIGIITYAINIIIAIQQHNVSAILGWSCAALLALSLYAKES
jgi:hypothetical protein